MSQKRYLVTGGGGFIGAALVRRLLAEGQQVRVLDNFSRGRPERLRDLPGDCELVTGDIRDPAAVLAACRGMDSVCHLAFVNGTQFFYSQPGLVLDVGVRGMINVLDACQATGVPELLSMSSSEVYQSPPQVPTAEDAPLHIPDPHNPRYSYAGAKLIGELMALHWARHPQMQRVLIVRPHNVYGPDMGWEHVIPQFAVRLAGLLAQPDPLPFGLQGDGSETRAFVHIDDFTDGLMAVLAKGADRQIYHLGSQEEISMADLARRVAACAGRTLALQPGPPAVGGTRRRCPNISKARALGYAPRRPLAAGLPAVVAWYLSHADQAPPSASKS